MSGTPRIQRWADEIRKGTRVGPTIFATGPKIKDEPLPIYDGIMAVDSPADAFVDELVAGKLTSVVEAASTAVDEGREVPVLSEEGLLTAAYLFAKRKEPEAAEQLVRLARKLHPDSYLSAYFHAGLFAMSGQPEKEQEALREVLRLVPNHAQARLRVK